MRDEDVERVRRIAGYRWRDVAGHEADFLTEDEVKNLSIRAGTLTEDERKVINHLVQPLELGGDVGGELPGDLYALSGIGHLLLQTLVCGP